MKTVVWIHGDCLSPRNPALLQNEGAAAVFVFDDLLLRRWNISFKRIVFMYECLLELPVTILRGDVVQEVTRFALGNGDGPDLPVRIVTTESPSPQFKRYCQAISQGLPKGSRIEVLPLEPFIEVERPLDLKRFSRYWNSVKDRVYG